MYKPVEEYNAFGGKTTKLYYCAAEVARQLGIDYNKVLKIIENNERYNHKYYRWFYWEEPKETKIDFYPLKQLKDGKIVNQFKNVFEASKLLNYGRNIIAGLVNNNKTDKWGCTWENLNKLP